MLAVLESTRRAGQRAAGVSPAPHWSCAKPRTPVRLTSVFYVTGLMVPGLHLMELKSCSGCLCDELIAWVKDIGSSASIKQKPPVGLCMADRSGVVIPPRCASLRSGPLSSSPPPAQISTYKGSWRSQHLDISKPRSPAEACAAAPSADMAGAAGAVAGWLQEEKTLSAAWCWFLDFPSSVFAFRKA